MTEQAGAKLKKIRQELGISLEDVHKKTKIHLNILKAIEGDSITNLSEVYLKSFLKIYCKFLGLDPDEYIVSFKESQKSAGPAGSSLVKEHQRVPVSKKPVVSLADIINFFKKIKGFLIFGLAFILFLFLAFNLGRFISSFAKRHQAQKKISRRMLPAKEALPLAVVKPSPKQEKPVVKALPQQKEAQGIRLGIRARENCFVTLKADGKVVFRRTLEKGRFETWQAKDKIELSLGNSGVVELEVNGQIFSKIGRKGQARKNIVITKEGIDLGK